MSTRPLCKIDQAFKASIGAEEFQRLVDQRESGIRNLDRMFMIWLALYIPLMILTSIPMIRYFL